jgi:ubiquinone/menaquinone biosynthesis C-methylase UbiE
VTTLDYDHLAAEYSRHRRAYPGLVEHIVQRSGIGDESTVLEVGCGTANHISSIKAKTGARCYGIDPSEQMLAVAANQGVELELKQARAEELPFAPETFDLILSVDVIHYVPAPEIYFAAALEALKPGGLLCTVTDSEDLIRNRVPMARYFPATIEVELSRFHSTARLAAALSATGFVDYHEQVIESSYLLADATRFEEKSYSSLHLITDEQFEQGITALRADLAEGPIQAILRSCAVWGRKPA